MQKKKKNAHFWTKSLTLWIFSSSYYYNMSFQPFSVLEKVAPKRKNTFLHTIATLHLITATVLLLLAEIKDLRYQQSHMNNTL